MEESSEPFASAPSVSFDGDGKRAFRGKSVRRRHASERYADRIHFYEPLRRTAPYAQSRHGLGGTWSWAPYPERRQRLISCLEREGHDNCHSLHKAEAWEKIPKLLSEGSVLPPQVKTRANGEVFRSFTLEAIMLQVESSRAEPNSRKQNGRTRRKHNINPGAIYELVHKRQPKLFAVPPTTPPEAVTGCLLVPRTVGGRGGQHALAPVIRSDNPRAAFDVESAGGVGAKKAFVEVDLGENCEISDFSTQGRHPPTRQYPSIRHERRSARAMHVGGEVSDTANRLVYEVEGRADWNLATHGLYEGPFWQVLSLRDERFHEQLALKRWREVLQWVTRYELLVRKSGGRGWRSLGIFRGNADATSEVAHSLRMFKGGVTARYVRFRPIETVGGGAMRVGVYGRRQGTDGSPTRLRHGSGAANPDADGPDLITYVLKETPKSRAFYTVKHGSLSRGRSCCREWKRTSRARRREELLRAGEERVATAA